MTLLEQRFFSLLRSGLRGGAPDAALFPADTDWAALYDLSFRQTVVGLVTDGIHHLPAECLPPQEETLDPFLGDVMFTETRNGQLNRALPRLVKALAGLRVAVVKGQPLGLNYPDPMRRQPGDIDLLLPPEDYARAREILVPKATRVEEEATEILHLGMFFGSIEVELHGTISTLMSRSLDAKLKVLQERMFRSGVAMCPVEGHPIPVPDVNFSAVYVFVHFLHHYWSGGIGLRQIIDWALLLERHHAEIDKAQLRADIGYLGMTRLWHAFLAFAATFLAMPAEAVDAVSWKPVRSGRREERIWRFIRSSGNFGKNEDRTRGEESYLVRKVHSFWMLVVRDRLRHFLTFPAASLRFFSGAFGYGLGRLLKGE